MKLSENDFTIFRKVVCIQKIVKCVFEFAKLVLKQAQSFWLSHGKPRVLYFSPSQ